MKIRVLVPILTLAVLTACAAPEPTPSPTAPAPTDTPTTTPSPTATASTPTPPPTATQIPSSTPILPTPVLPESDDTNFYLADLLFSQADGSCQLPCWRGLTPGQSTGEQTRNTVLDVFGRDLNEERSYNFSSVPGSTRESIPHYYSTGLDWYVPESDPPPPSLAEVHIDSVYVNDSIYLQSLGFRWGATDTDAFKVHLAPLQVIQELGAPDRMFAQAESSAKPDYGSIHVMMLYNKGIVVEFAYSIFAFDVTWTTDGNPEKVTGKLCLSENETSGNFEIYLGNLYLMNSFSNALEDLDPFQDAFIQGKLEWFRYQPVEFLTGMTGDEIAERALNGEDVCLTFEVDKRP